MSNDVVTMYTFSVYYTIMPREPYFQWMFGVKEPGFYGAVEVETGKSLLFMPELPKEYGIWMGRLLTRNDFKQMYAVDEVHFVTNLKLEMVVIILPGATGIEGPFSFRRLLVNKYLQ
ncbi:hypothetical protein L9F63_020101, partial [Diploptera punctata]